MNLALAMNATAAESLTRPDLPEPFVPELRDLIVALCLRL
jgi:hypothetical protein